jgi:Holliday junction resolvasome RuvABC DNA-binding subunit
MPMEVRTVRLAVMQRSLECLGAVFGMLCAMGFRQKEARSMIDAARRDLPPDAGIEEAMRRALSASSFVGVREHRAVYAPRAPPWAHA